MPFTTPVDWMEWNCSMISPSSTMVLNRSVALRTLRRLQLGGSGLIVAAREWLLGHALDLFFRGDQVVQAVGDHAEELFARLGGIRPGVVSVIIRSASLTIPC
jgi:hypothetical protein